MGSGLADDGFVAGPDQGEDADAGLLAAYARGEAIAARMLTERLAPRAFGQAMRWLANRDEAEEVAQEAMLRLWRQAPDWRPGGARVTTWLYRVVANLATDRLRQRRFRPLDDRVDEPADPARSAAAGMQQAQRMRALSDALARLPDRQAQAVALRHLEGLANPEIARIMDISVGAVESLVARGRRSLAADLGPRRAELGFDDDDA